MGTIADLLPALKYQNALAVGRLIAPHCFAVASVAANVLTTAPNILASGDAVSVHWLETAPTLGSGSLSRATTYYWHALSTTTGTLHASHEDGVSGDSAIAFSNAGSGFYICKDLPFAITRSTGRKRTYLNAAPIKFPTLTLAGGKRFFSGDLTLRAYPKHGAAGSEGVSAFYTEEDGAYSAPAWDDSKVLCARELQIAWGGSAPWNAISTEMGVEISLEPQLDPLGNGIFPRASDIFKGLKVTVKLRPQGITGAEYDAILSELLGQQLEQHDLTIYDGTYDYTIHGAALVAPQAKKYGASERITPEITFEALGSASSAGRAPLTIVED